jgi:aminopeptidase-like protein/aminoglycoside N3'-acetyltransferase
VTSSEYSRSDLAAGLRKIGIERGDIVFFQVCLETIGPPRGCATPEQVCELLFDVLHEAVGPEGTILVPTYTFSFCRQEIFDPRRTPTISGPWNTFADFPEYVRLRPGALRSEDPIFSITGLGPHARELLTDLPHTCLGAGSAHERIRHAGAKLCNLGIGLFETTFQHHAEEIAQVPWRFKKLFTGSIRNGNTLRKEGWLYNVRIRADNAAPYGHRLEQKAREANLCRVAGIGRGEVLAIDSREYFALAMEELARDPWYTAKGPASDPIELEEARVNGRRYDIRLPENASLAQMIDAVWALPRDIVSDAYDAALEALATQVPMTIHEYPTGTECWSWLIPEKWTCHEAYLETLDGRRLFSYADNPLHVVSYSLPFDGEITRDVLLNHLHVHPFIPEAIPFIFKYYERDWGLCSSRQLKESLADERYRVVIRTDFSYGTLKVGEVVVPGRSDETIVLCTHLCHPAMVNDDLTGVVVGIKVMSELLKRRDLRYTYRLLIVPETIGSVAYLSHHEELIPKMKGGLFLEMLGRDYPHALQFSFDGNTEVDQCFSLALKGHDPYGWTGPFRTIIGNDERQFNAPGVRVPMLSLSRVLPSAARGLPYQEYHSSYDTPDRVPVKRLEESCDLVLRMIDTLENNRVPVNKFKGEVFCSRYGLHIDWFTDRENSRALFDILFLVDGTQTVAQIANTCGISFEAAKRVTDTLQGHGLVEYIT